VGEGTRVGVRLPLDCERAQPPKGSVPPAGVTSYLTAHVANNAARLADPVRGREDAASSIDIRVKKSA
jgi:hypothetical protein